MNAVPVWKNVALSWTTFFEIFGLLLIYYDCSSLLEGHPCSTSPSVVSSCKRENKAMSVCVTQYAAIFLFEIFSTQREMKGNDVPVPGGEGWFVVYRVCLR
jgi:hypothetical protein